jgi:K+-sensing histidine kinase KdpD
MINKIKYAGDNIIMNSSIDISTFNIITSYRFYVIGSLLRSIIHEINSPLTAMDINTKSLEILIKQINDNKESTGEIDEIIDDMNKGIFKITDITTHVRSLLLINASNNICECSPNTIIDRCLKLICYKTRYNAEIKKEFEPNLNQIMTNVFMLESSILNLMLNSAEAIEKHGKGTIRVSTANINENSIKIIISDDGVGLNPEQLANFNRSEYCATYSDSNHLGLGIYLTKFFMSQINGSIRFENNSIGGLDSILTIQSSK